MEAQYSQLARPTSLHDAGPGTATGTCFCPSALRRAATTRRGGRRPSPSPQLLLTVHRLLRLLLCSLLYPWLLLANALASAAARRPSVAVLLMLPAQLTQKAPLCVLVFPVRAARVAHEQQQAAAAAGITEGRSVGNQMYASVHR